MWARSYNGPGNGDDRAVAVSVSPSGATVFVTGVSQGLGTGEDFATEALNAHTGVVLWTHRYNGPGNTNDVPVGLAVAPDGSRVFVTGSFAAASTGTNYATVAYNAATGAFDWTERLTSGADAPSDLVATADGKAVVVTGTDAGASTGNDYFTRAFDPVSGKTLWSSRYNSGGANSDTAVAIGAAPDSSTIFVTGTILVGTTHKFATLALNATTGVRVWTKQFAGLGNSSADALAVDPDGSKIFLVGHDGKGQETVAYQAATGDKLWSDFGHGPEGGNPLSLAVTPDGSAVFVVGTLEQGSDPSLQFAATRHDAATGKFGNVMMWGRPSFDIADAAVVSPDGSTLYVIGESEGNTFDYATVAFPAGG